MKKGPCLQVYVQLTNGNNFSFSILDRKEILLSPEAFDFLHEGDSSGLNGKIGVLEEARAWYGIDRKGEKVDLDIID